MTQQKLPEVWQRGPVTGISATLQPVAHALLQAREELIELMKDFPDRLLNEKPADMASAAFHLRHLSGVLDRLFTYARGEALSEQQFAYLKAETEAIEHDLKTGEPAAAVTHELIQHFSVQVQKAMEQLMRTPENSLLETRYIGRAKIETNVLGLLFHAAEHTMRHLGQLLVTAKIVMQHVS